MSSMLESLMGQLGGGNLGSLSKAVGADEKSTETALAAALPMLLAGLAKNTAQNDGAAALHRALEKDHDGSLLDDVGAFLGRGDTAPGQGIVRHVFGDRQSVVEKGISKSSGIDPAQAAKLLAIAAPMIMAYLGKQRRQASLDPASLGRMLTEQNQTVQKTAPQLGGLARLLDADGDGSIADDIAKGVLGKLFRR
jgi:hypothetical protein